jgi:hypothetical protein
MTALEQINKILKTELVSYLNSRPIGMHIHPIFEKDFIVTKVDLALSNDDYKQDAESKFYTVEKKAVKAYFNYTQFQKDDKRNNIFSFDLISAVLNSDFEIEKIEIKCDINPL